jgi:hypothetical protein
MSAAAEYSNASACDEAFAGGSALDSLARCWGSGYVGVVVRYAQSLAPALMTVAGVVVLDVLGQHEAYRPS